MPGSALNRHHLGEVDNSSKSIRHRLTATVRNLIHEFLPSGAGDSQAERYAIARGWLSQGEHQKDDMELEAQQLMMVLWSVQRVEVSLPLVLGLCATPLTCVSVVALVRISKSFGHQCPTSSLLCVSSPSSRCSSRCWCSLHHSPMSRTAAKRIGYTSWPLVSARLSYFRFLSR